MYHSFFIQVSENVTFYLQAFSWVFTEPLPYVCMWQALRIQTSSVSLLWSVQSAEVAREVRWNGVSPQGGTQERSPAAGMPPPPALPTDSDTSHTPNSTALSLLVPTSARAVTMAGHSRLEQHHKKTPKEQTKASAGSPLRALSTRQTGSIPVLAGMQLSYWSPCKMGVDKSILSWCCR